MKLFVINSPLQFLGAISYINSNTPSILLYRSDQKQLVFMLESINPRNCIFMGYSNALNFIKALFNLIPVIKNIKELHIGDIRSSYVLFIFSLINFFPFLKSITIYDDGQYSIWMDKKINLEINARFYFFKKKIMASILNYSRINRITFFDHNILQSYSQISRLNFSNVLNEYSVFIFSKSNFDNKRCLYYVESSLQGWLVKDDDERLIYNKLEQISLETNLTLVVLSHRASDCNRIRKFLNGSVTILKLELPVEFYMSQIVSSKSILFFSVTTAALTFRQLHPGLVFETVLLNPNRFKKKYEGLINNYYNELRLICDFSFNDFL